MLPSSTTWEPPRSTRANARASRQKGLPISSIARINWNRRHFQKVVQRDDGLGRQKPTRRRHDKRRTKASRRIRKSFRIGKLAAKIQAADEAEEFPERGAVSPDALGEFEFGIPVQQQIPAMQSLRSPCPLCPRARGHSHRLTRAL